MVIVLQSTDGELRLSADDTGWCTVELLTSGGWHQLGADAFDVVMTKLSRGLDEKLPGQSSGTIKGVDVQWVLSLAERHWSVYAADVDDRRVLFCQGADGDLLDKLRLDELTDPDGLKH